MRRLVHGIDALHTCDDDDRVLADAWIVVEGERIAALGEGEVPPGEFDDRIDLAGSVAMPGLVNLHHHFFQTLTRAVPRLARGHLLDWLRLAYPVWSGMEPDDLEGAAAATMAELLLTGATTTVDHAYLVPRSDAAYPDAIVRARAGSGMRLHLVHGSITALEASLEDELTPLLGARAGGIVEAPRDALAAMAATIGRHHATGWGARVSVALGPTTTTFDDPAFMEAVARLAGEAGCGLHLHLHPRPDERAASQARHGMSPTAFLAERGWLTDRTWFAHATRLDADDQRRLAAAGCAVAHCPRMVARLGARTTPIHDYLAAGIRVGIGVDGGASNDSGSMLGELRLALLLHRLAGGEGEVPWESWLDPPDLLRMATRGAADILRRDDIGRIAVGCCADLAAFDMRGVGFAGARTDLLSGLLLAGDDTRASLTMVAGEPKVRNGVLLGQDEERLRRRVDAATSRLLARATSMTGESYDAFPSRGRPGGPSRTAG